MPVVSQSIIRPIVPVGASTEACELRTPKSAAISHASSHDCCAALEQLGGHAAPRRCAAPPRGACRAPRSMCSLFSAKPANGPMRPAVRAEVA